MVSCDEEFLLAFTQRPALSFKHISIKWVLPIIALLDFKGGMVERNNNACLSPALTVCRSSASPPFLVVEMLYKCPPSPDYLTHRFVSIHQLRSLD
jgi:hypothetical protein